MNAVKGTRYRPDPYIDWELQICPDKQQSNRWCSVIVQIKGDDQAAQINNLKKLKEQVATERQVRMTADEFALLSKEIADLDPPQQGQPVKRVWFVYLTEKRIYKSPKDAAQDGVGYNDQDEPYDIVYAGPPIETISADKRSSIKASDQTKCSEQVAAGKPRVITAVIDDGIAFANDRFLMPDPSGGGRHPLATRVAAIWLQDLETKDGDHGVVIGKRLHGEELNKVNDMIKDGECDSAIYRKMGVVDFSRPGHQSLAYRLAHGTHVMDLACGMNDDETVDSNGDGAADLKPDEWPILAVQLPSRVTADTSGQMLTSYALQALRTIMLWAESFGKDVPLVINFSYGFSAGPKDGSLTIETEIARLVSERQGETAVVLPSGNSYQNRTTARFELGIGKSDEIFWTIPPDDQTDNFIEMWVDDDQMPGSPLRLTLTSPNGDDVTSDNLSDGGVNVLKNVHGETIAAIYYDRLRDNNHNKRHRLFLAVSRTKVLDDDFPTSVSGDWRIKAENCRQSKATEFWAHVQRDDTPPIYRLQGRQSYFDHFDAYGRDRLTGDYQQLGANCPIKHEGTINAIATGEHTVVVGGAINDVIDKIIWPAAEYSSMGFEGLDDKPLTSAFSEEGHATPGIMAAGSRSGSTAIMRGTSVAAPQVARLLAGLMANNMSAADAIACIKQGQPQKRVHKLDDPDKRRGHSVVKLPEFDHIPQRRYPAT